MRALVSGIVGCSAGLLAGYFFFSSADQARDGAKTSASNASARELDHRIRLEREGEPGLGDPGGASKGTFDGTLHLPRDYWDKLEISSFESAQQSPWASDHEAFVVSKELRELCQLDEQQCELIRQRLLGAREEYMAPQWESPRGIRQEGDAIVIEIPPAPAALEDSIHSAIMGAIGEDRAKLFMDKAEDTLDWEFGGFGRLRRVVEVSVFPNDTLSLRESLRPTEGSVPSHMSAEQARAHRQFETRVRQYRLDQLPPAIAKFVKVEKSGG